MALKKNEVKNLNAGQMNDGIFSLEQVVKDFEDYFFRSKRGELYKFILESVEKPMIESVLDKTDGNQLKAARILGINRNTLHSKIKKLGIEVGKWKRT